MNKAASRDSKEQILVAFKEVLAEQKKLESRIATKEEEAEKAKNKELLETASTYTVDSIVKGLADLQLDFGSIIQSLATKLTSETTKLDELKRSIEIENQHLEELQKIRIVADVLHILNLEHQETLRSLEQTHTEERERLEKEQTNLHKAWQKEQETFEFTTQEQAARLAADRQRETDDYQYQLERVRKVETDEYEEIKRNLERELQEAEKEKQKQWQERTKVLDSQQAEFTENQKKVEAYPKELEEAVKKAREEAIKDTSQDAKVQADLIQKEWEAAKQSYELKVQSLEQTIERQTEQIAEMSAQLQAVMQQAQNLAMRAFETSNNKN